MSTGALDALRTIPPQRGWGLVAFLIMLVLAAGVGWAVFAELDEVAVANGEVVPQGNTKLIQHLEGGVVRELLVSNGDHVTAGKVLLRLDLGTVGLNRAELEVRRDGLALRRARLAAEAAGEEASFPEDVAKRQRALVEAERKAFAARERQLRTARRVLAEQAQQRALEVRELNTRRAALQQDLKLAREKLVISDSLLSDGLTSRLEHLEAQRDVARLQGEVRSVSARIRTAQAAEAEAAARSDDVLERFRSDVREQLGTVEVDLRRVEELLAEATRQTGRTEIRSPIDGIVKNMRINAVGGVVRPGEPIMEIVPERDRLVVEARLDPADRGYVRVGQPAIVKISTYDFIRYGGLTGKVVRIAPDTDTSSGGEPFFRVVVETDRSWLGEREGALPISPGMQASVDIRTGRRTVANYLLRPVLKLRSEAFRER